MPADIVLETLSFEDLPPEQRWIWLWHIPRDKFTIVSGDWGAGKTHAFASIITSILKREPFPDGDYSSEDPGHIFIVTTESNRGELTKMFRAQGCTDEEIGFIHIIPMLKDSTTNTQVMFDLDLHLAILEKWVKQYRPLMVMFDPLIEFHSRKEIDTKAIRSLMVMLNAFCERNQTAGIGLLHWNKDSKLDRRYRTSGSHQYNAGVKSVIIVERDRKNKDTRFFIQEKMTLGPEPPDLKFTIEKPDGLVVWSLPAKATDSTEVEAAKKFLIEFLANGPRTPSECYDNSDINERVIRTARARLGPMIITHDKYISHKYVQVWELVGPDNMWGIFELKTGKSEYSI